MFLLKRKTHIDFDALSSEMFYPNWQLCQNALLEHGLIRNIFSYYYLTQNYIFKS